MRSSIHLRRLSPERISRFVEIDPTSPDVTFDAKAKIGAETNEPISSTERSLRDEPTGDRLLVVGVLDEPNFGHG